MTARCLIVTPDLLGASQLQNAARAAGLAPVTARGGDLAAHAGVRAVIVDLGRAGVDVVAQAARLVPRPFIAAIGPHVDAALLQRARDAGADVALPHSAVGGALVRTLADATAGPASKTASNRRGPDTTTGHP